MKKALLKIIPGPLLHLYRKIRYGNKKTGMPSFLGKPVEETFTEIYKTNFWGSKESISGAGSASDQTATIVSEIGKLIKKIDVKTLLDIPCGDFLWMQNVDLSEVKYTGADIVEELILKNRSIFDNNRNIEFEQINLISDTLPVNDLIISRDCLVHLSFQNIYDAVKNIKSSGCKYLLTTTFPGHPENKDIITGDWRTLNLTQAPFNFPEPMLLINENCTEFENQYVDKSLGLWLVDELPLPPSPYQ